MNAFTACTKSKQSAVDACTTSVACSAGDSACWAKWNNCYRAATGECGEAL